ncbi:hypothetical protein FQZ97_829640 [compost metagenome]
MHSNLLKHPYGCWRCGCQLGTPRDQQTFQFISAMGLERLRRAHQLLALGKQGRVVFDIGSAATFPCDTVLQLSLSLWLFARVENDLFRSLQQLACKPSLNSALARYPTFLFAKQGSGVAPEAGDEALANELASIRKSVFRAFKKRHFPGLRLSVGLLSIMWRDIQGASLPPEYYGVLAYLDWLSYWCNAKVPGDLSHSPAGCQRKMKAWIAATRKHSVFQRACTPASERWLLRQILVCEITTLLQRQVEQGWAHEQTSEPSEDTTVLYRRLVYPICWAVFFSQDREGRLNMTFISALSWKGTDRYSHGANLHPGVKSFRRSEFLATLKSLMA